MPMTNAATAVTPKKPASARIRAVIARARVGADTVVYVGGVAPVRPVAKAMGSERTVVSSPRDRAGLPRPRVVAGAEEAGCS